MTTQVTVKNLSPVTYNQIPVITTELLARLYGTEASVYSRITMKINLDLLRENTSLKLLVMSSKICD